MNKVLVSVAWPYVNGDQHVGHLGGYLLPADIFARYQRMRGRDVLMISGSDCHGTPTTIYADKEGITPEEVVRKFHKRDVDLFNQYNLQYNLYTKTDTDNHREVVQKLFMDLLENDYIVKDTMNQYYSVDDKKFLPDRYVEGECSHCHAKDQRSDQCEACGRWLEEGELINPKSKLSGSEVVLKETEHYFLDFEKLSEELTAYVKSKKDIWKRWVYAEAKGWLDEGLRKRAITRDLDFGVDLPVEEIKKLDSEKQLSSFKGKKIYVWFEAVTGYLSASVEWSKLNSEGKSEQEVENKIFNTFAGQDTNWKNFWLDKNSKHFYFMGQDNLVFHTLMWPAQLMGTNRGYTLPHNVVVNKFLNYEGKAFSKSRNWTISSAKIGEMYGVDAVRYYLSSILPENKTSNFTWDGFVDGVNNELVANLGNFIHRTLSFIQSKFDGKVPEGEITNEVRFQIRDAFPEVEDLIERVKLNEALARIFKLASFANKYFDRMKVWEVVKKDKEEAGNILFNCVQLISAFRYLLMPYLPESMERLAHMLGEEELKYVVGKDLWRRHEIEAGREIKDLEVLFEKLDRDEVMENIEKMT